MRADCPNWDVEDVHAAWAEQEYKADVNTPMDLYNKVQHIVPATSSLVIEDPTGDNQLRSPPRPTLKPCTVLLAGALVHYRSETSRRMQAAQAAGHGKQPVTAC